MDGARYIFVNIVNCEYQIQKKTHDTIFFEWKLKFAEHKNM